MEEKKWFYSVVEGRCTAMRDWSHCTLGAVEIFIAASSAVCKSIYLVKYVCVLCVYVFIMM